MSRDQTLCYQASLTIGVCAKCGQVGIYSVCIAYMALENLFYKKIRILIKSIWQQEFLKF